MTLFNSLVTVLKTQYHTTTFLRSYDFSARSAKIGVHARNGSLFATGTVLPLFQVVGIPVADREKDYTTATLTSLFSKMDKEYR